MTAAHENIQQPTWLNALPQVRGKYLHDFALSGICWLRVGGPADVVFIPADKADLAAFLKDLPTDIPVTILGAGSNTLIRDAGVRGVVIRLGAGFGDIMVGENHTLHAGAAVLDVKLARAAADLSLSGFEFYRGIPGAIGGALVMNAGAYGSETGDRLIRVEGLTRKGAAVELTPAELGLAYRHNGYDDFIVYTDACFVGTPGDQNKIRAAMANISDKREASQPVKSRTGGSTFKNPGSGNMSDANPEGPKAWQLLDAAECRGLSVGDARFSQLHCNFLINHGTARAGDLEQLGEMARQRVLENSGIELQWEIKRIGVATYDG